jgi:hypothetical protein
VKNETRVGFASGSVSPLPRCPSSQHLAQAAIAARHLAVIDSLSYVRAQHQIADLVTSKSSRIRSPPALLSPLNRRRASVEEGRERRGTRKGPWSLGLSGFLGGECSKNTCPPPSLFRYREIARQEIEHVLAILLLILLPQLAMSCSFADPDRLWLARMIE